MSTFLSSVGWTFVNTAEVALNAITPALHSAGSAGLKIGQEVIVPVVSETSKAALKFGQEQVLPAMTNAVKNAAPAAVTMGEWMASHPGQTAIYAVNGASVVATAAFPGLLAGPALSMAGFGPIGVQGASLAAASQPAVVAAGGLFATLTSYGMGGYGVAAVHGAVRIGVAVLGAAGVGAAAGVAAVAA